MDQSKFLSEAFKGRGGVLYYLWGILLIIIGWQIVGVLPLVPPFVKEILAGNQVSSPFDLYDLGYNKELILILLLCSFVCGFISLWLVLKFLQKKSIRASFTARSRFSWRRVFLGILLWMIIGLVSTLGISFFTDSMVVEWNFQLYPFILLVLICLTLLPIQTTFEEWFFRSYLMQALAAVTKSTWLSLVLVALLFAALHIFNPEVEKFGLTIMFPQYLIMGLLLGIITIMDDGLELAIGIHFINNFMGSVFMTHADSALQTNALYIVKDMQISHWDNLISLCVSIITLLIFKYIFKWGSFSKLFLRLKPTASVDE